jgi:hypothetical protein
MGQGDQGSQYQGVVTTEERRPPERRREKIAYGCCSFQRHDRVGKSTRNNGISSTASIVEGENEIVAPRGAARGAGRWSPEAPVGNPQWRLDNWLSVLYR